MEVSTLQEKGAIEPLKLLLQNSGFYSTYSVIPKMDQEWASPHIRSETVEQPPQVLQVSHALYVRHLAQMVYHHGLEGCILTCPHWREGFPVQSFAFRYLSGAKGLHQDCGSSAVPSKGMRICPYLNDWLICSLYSVQYSRKLQ